MNEMKRLLVVIMCLLGFCAAFAQPKLVTGVVLSQNENAPLQGVTVTNRNTSQKTQTAQDGTFSISAEKGHVLVLSYVGFASQEFPLGDQTQVSISLAPAQNTTLEDVVVVGYGSQKKA